MEVGINYQLQPLIDFYNDKIHKMWGITAGGRLRALKAALVETIAEMMVQEAWRALGGVGKRLAIERRFYSISDEQGNQYSLSQDKQVYVDGRFILSMECKAYTEVAMYKRVLLDSYILQEAAGHPICFCLFQLESQLGGDYSSDPGHPQGSPSVNALNAFFRGHFGPINLEVITLLDGERDIKREIHKPEYYKPLTIKRLIYGLNFLAETLTPYL